MEKPTTFPILEITHEMRGEKEPLGSKPKFWFRLGDEVWLFKAARENTGEDWSEKIASELAAMLEMRTHHTELAVCEETRGCAVKSFLEQGQREVLFHGNDLLSGAVENYDKHKIWGQADHTFSNIVKALEFIFLDEKARREVGFQMVGYTVLDALVGNTDRHHQNWGIVRSISGGQGKEFAGRLAPTFDHASSLGRELTDEARRRHLDSRTISRYIEAAKGGIFGDAADKKGLSPMEVVRRIAREYPEFFGPWQTRVGRLTDEGLQNLLSRVPESRMSSTAHQFVLEFLRSSVQIIQNIKIP